jgi:hypothetical protein
VVPLPFADSRGPNGPVLLLLGRCLAILLLASLWWLGCGGSSPTAPRSRVELSLTLETPHFTILYSQPDAEIIGDYAAELEANYDRIVGDFLMNGIPRVTARFYPDQEAYTAATGYQSRGNTWNSGSFSVISRPFVASRPVHEFTHCVTLVFYPNSSATSWLFETVALYEADQLYDPRTISCLRSGDFPTIRTIGSSGDCSIYHVGYTVGEMIVEIWGFDGMRRLILADGDVPSALGITWAQFQSMWEQFVTDRYL